MSGLWALFILGARALAPRHRQKKMVLCSGTANTSTLQFPSIRWRPCPRLNSGVGTHLKKGRFYHNNNNDDDDDDDGDDDDDHKSGYLVQPCPIIVNYSDLHFNSAPFNSVTSDDQNTTNDWCFSLLSIIK